MFFKYGEHKNIVEHRWINQKEKLRRTVLKANEHRFILLNHTGLTVAQKRREHISDYDRCFFCS